MRKQIIANKKQRDVQIENEKIRVKYSVNLLAIAFYIRREGMSTKKLLKFLSIV